MAATSMMLAEKVRVPAARAIVTRRSSRGQPRTGTSVEQQIGEPGNCAPVTKPLPVHQLWGFLEAKLDRKHRHRSSKLVHPPRDGEEFQQNIRSIRDVGLLKPIVVNGRYFKKTGNYDLVCGEGRFLAYKKLKRQEIPAEVISCNQKQALVHSLVENIARVPPGTMWFAQEVKRMFDSGCPLQQISNITGYSETYIQDYIRLAEQGEERLLKGVEAGLFPISFALQVARSDSSSIQNLLMDAFDSGIVNSSNFPTVRNIIMLRVNRGKKPLDSSESSPSPSESYSVRQLTSDIQRITKHKEAFVKEAALKENRLLTILDGLNTLWNDEVLVNLIKSEGIGSLPNLKGEYNVQ